MPDEPELDFGEGYGAWKPNKGWPEAPFCQCCASHGTGRLFLADGPMGAGSLGWHSDTTCPLAHKTGDFDA